MGKTLKKKEKELRRKPKHKKKIDYSNIVDHLQLTKIPTSKYKREDVENVITLLEYNLIPQEIEKESVFSTTQIKKIRFILAKGSKIEKEMLLKAKYYPASIKRYIQNKKKHDKRMAGGTRTNINR